MIIKFRSYLYLILSAVLLGAIGIFVKLIGTDIPFMTLMFYRMFFGFILVLVVVPFMDKNWYKVNKTDLGHYLIVSVLMTITFSLFVVANLFASVQNVVLITNFAPFVVLILAYFFLKEKITKTKIITLIIAIIGIIILNPFKLDDNFFGNILALIQTLFYAVLVVFMRKENQEHEIGSVIWFLFFASLMLLPFPFIYGLGNLSGKIIWYVFGLGILSTGVSYLFQNLALQKVGAEISSIIIMIIMPLSAIFLAFFVLHEGLDYRVLLGGLILIISGVYLQAHNKKIKEVINLSLGIFGLKV